MLIELYNKRSCLFVMTQDVRSQGEDVRCCLYDPRRTLAVEIQ